MARTVPLLRLGNTLLTTVMADLKDAVAERFQHELLEEIERTGASGLVIDISALDIVDTYVARVLADTAKMARLMGTRTVLVGMPPEVAATLVQMGFTLEGVETALNLDDGLALLHGKRAFTGAKPWSR